jgi:prephenate dehydrogenase
MGSWFAAVLHENGQEVAIYDLDSNAARILARKKRFKIVHNLEHAIRSSHVIVLATPTRKTVTMLEEIKRWISPGTLIVDISSVKEPLRGQIRRLHSRNIPVLSIHPMFGPGTRTLKGRTIFVTSIPKRDAHASRILSILRRRGARMVRCGVEEHDRLMAALLTLPHFLSIAMVKTLRTRGLDPGRLRHLSGTTFRLQLLIAEATHQENPEIEASILMDSKYSTSIIREFARQCTATLRLMGKSRERMIADLSSSRKYLQSDREFRSAYESFNAAIAGVR